MASSKLVMTSSKNFVKVWLFKTSFKAKFINVSFSGKTVSSLPMWMIALFSGITLLTLTLLFHLFMRVLRTFSLLIKAELINILAFWYKTLMPLLFEMSQSFLICWILGLLSLDEHKIKGRETPVGKPLLNRDLGGVPCKHTWSIKELLECSVI